MNIFLQGAVLTAALIALFSIAIIFLTDTKGDEVELSGWWFWPGLMLAALPIAAALV